jgi:hypothetical protein
MGVITRSYAGAVSAPKRSGEWMRVDVLTRGKADGQLALRAPISQAGR